MAKNRLTVRADEVPAGSVRINVVNSLYVTEGNENPVLNLNKGKNIEEK